MFGKSIVIQIQKLQKQSSRGVLSISSGDSLKDLQENSHAEVQLQ